MYKLVIVDDEDIIRHGIASSINWEEHGFRLAGEAASGQEAWNMIKEVQPELVICDIYMPDIDGIHLAEQIKSQFPEIIVIFLSGYSEFDYAKKAVNLGVFRYLTKPVKTRELIEVLAEVMEEIQYKYEEKERIKKITEQVKESLSLLRDQFLKGLVHRRIPETEIFDSLTFLDMRIQGDAFFVMIAALDDYSELLRRCKGTEVQLFRLSIVHMIQNRLGDENYYPLVFQLDSGEIVVLCGFDKGKCSNVRDDIYIKLSNIQLMVQKQLHITISISIGKEVDRLVDVSESYAQAAAAMDHKLLVGKNSIVYYGDIEQMGEGRVFFNFDKNTELIQYIRGANEEAAVCISKELFESIRNMKITRKNHIFILVAELVNQVIRVVMESSDEPESVYGKGFDPYAGIYDNETLDDMMAWLEDFIRKSTAHVRNRIKTSSRQFVDHARKFIDEHYQNENLNLSMIAEGVYISPCYLSQVFKKVTGENVSEYLTRVRIEKAKKLLKDVSKKTYEIAYQVGFRDAHYFSSCFKKQVGISPSEYRDCFNFDIDG